MAQTGCVSANGPPHPGARVRVLRRRRPARHPPCPLTHVNPVLRVGGTDTSQLDTAHIRATATVIGRQVRITVSVERNNARFAPSGTYVGTVSIIDPRIERVDIPLTVTMSYPVWQLPLAVLLASIPLAIGYLWLLKGSFHGRAPLADQRVTAGDFENYVFSRNGILALAPARPHRRGQRQVRLARQARRRPERATPSGPIWSQQGSEHGGSCGRLVPRLHCAELVRSLVPIMRWSAPRPPAPRRPRSGR
jgi:hypothetical protein